MYKQLRLSRPYVIIIDRYKLLIYKELYNKQKVKYWLEYNMGHWQNRKVNKSLKVKKFKV